MNLLELLNHMYESTTEQERAHGGFGNKDGMFSNVPYQMIRTLYHSPIERNELKRLSYLHASAQGSQKNPYASDFAKMFDSYIKEINKVLHRMNGDLQIRTFHSLSRGCFYLLN